VRGKPARTRGADERGDDTGRLAPPARQGTKNLVTGTFRRTAKGFGFVRPEGASRGDKAGDIYIAAPATMDASDRVTHCRGEPEPQIAAKERAPAAAPVRTARAELTPPSRTTRSLPRGRGIPAEETLVVNDDGDDSPSQRGAPPAARAPAPSAERTPDRSQDRPLVQALAPAERPRMCKVWTASYGGSRNVLIQTIVGEELHLTALQVIDGQEEELAATFIESHAVGGRRIGDAYPNREAALIQAFDICPQAARLQR
jgi:hypothetical protein